VDGERFAQATGGFTALQYMAIIGFVFRY